MSSISRISAIVCVAVIALSSVMALMTEDIAVALADILVVVCMVPCAVFGMWMAITDQPEMWINGFDSLPLERRRAVARFFGVSMAAGSIVMSGSIAVMMNGALVAGILIFVASMIIFFYPMRYLASKRPRVPEVSIPRKYQIPSLIAVSVLTVIAIPLAGCISGDSGEVRISFGAESVAVDAPMFDYDFAYSDIEGIVYFEDFEKGRRVVGYADGRIASGTFKNSDLGRYELASYVKVDPCIVISYMGEQYAFNQSDEASTRAVYDTLLSHIPVSERVHLLNILTTSPSFIRS